MQSRTCSSFAEAQPDFAVFDGKITQKTRNYFDNNFGFSFTFYRIVSFNNLLELCSSSLTFGNVNEFPFLSLNRDLLPIDDI